MKDLKEKSGLGKFRQYPFYPNTTSFHIKQTIYLYLKTPTLDHQ